MISPTKSFAKTNIFFKTTIIGNSPTKIEKLSKESTIEYSDNWIEDYKKSVWLINSTNEKCNNIKELLPDLDNDYESLLNYLPSEDGKHSLNYDDGLVKCISVIGSLALKYKFI